MDYRRAGLFGQPQQRRRRLVRASRLVRLRRSGPGLLQRRSDVRRSRGLRADLLRSRRCPGLLRSRRRPDLLRPGPGRLRSVLLRSGADLLHAVLWLLQAEEVPSRLVRGLQERLRQNEEEPLLQHGLRTRRADLLRSGRSQLLRSGRLRADLRRSRDELLPLIADDLPGDGGEFCSTQTSPQQPGT